MRFKLFFLFISSFLFADEVEVRLKTKSDLKQVYLPRIHTDPNEFDWRYFKELREVLETDFNYGGFINVLPVRDDWEEKFRWPDVKKHFEIAYWRREKIPFVFAANVLNKSLYITVFNVEKETSKRYPEIPLGGQLNEDRKRIHKIADAIHKDLFGIEGIASLRLIYSTRSRDTDTSNFVSDIWMSDYDGSNARQMTIKEDYCVSPSFFPHTAGQEAPPFFYVSYKMGQSKIFHRKQGESELIFELRGSQVLPTINPHGSQMAFISDVAGRPDLFVQNFDSVGRPLGKSRQLFSAPRATQASPTYSPNGQRIAFVSDKDGPPRIYLIDVTSSKSTKRIKPKMLTKRNRQNTSPSWSPDGKKLAYSAKVDGVRQIWLYDFELEEEIPLTVGPSNKENPTWASNSLHLVYNTDNDEEGQLFLINLMDKRPVQITKDLGQKRFASFESR
jgi:TolB protein